MCIQYMMMCVCVCVYMSLQHHKGTSLQPSDSVAYDTSFVFQVSSDVPLFPCLLPQHLSFPFSYFL